MHAASGAPVAPITLFLLAAPAANAQAQGLAQEPVTNAFAQLMDSNGNEVGTVELYQTPTGVVLLGRFDGLPEGAHGFHIHETGNCSPFEAAGDHLNPAGVDHGFYATTGPHAGDLPNLYVPSNGIVAVDFFTPFIRVSGDIENSLIGDDSAAIVVHAGADDYQSQPSGESGDPIACGVIQAGDAP